MNPVSSEARPHPMRMSQGVIVDGHLVATWLDRELMLACMGSMPTNVAENGHQRDEIRTSIGTRTTHYPAGTTWAHALDAEPMAMASDGEVVGVELYHRGLYGIGLNADEHWRMPTQNGPIPSADHVMKKPSPSTSMMLNAGSLLVEDVYNDVHFLMDNSLRNIYSNRLRLHWNTTSNTASMICCVQPAGRSRGCLP